MPTPNFANVSYGEHPRQRFDVYLPSGAKGPVPCVFFIHGGAWIIRDKRENLERFREPLAAAGIALVSVNYRYLRHAQADGLNPPVLGPLQDSARALQTFRHRAAEYGIDPQRVALMGESAGAFTALWIGLGDERADPTSDDPIARQSTRVLAIGVNEAQTSLDSQQMRAWVGPELTYGPHAFGLQNNAAGFIEFLQRRAEFAAWFEKLSPAALLTCDDPPVFLYYGGSLTPTEPLNSYYTHSPRFGIGFKAEADRIGVACTLVYTGMEDRPADNTLGFLIKVLRP